ncbi:MAG: glycosyltransferase [Blastocatellia bacterium]|nr:glycosyltransferase [Blastocatellia bacterium]
MKSVHITNYYHKNSGGISTSFNNLMAAAERRKREVRLIVPGETEGEEQVNDYAKIYYVPAKYSPVFDKRYRIILPWQYMNNDSLIRKIMLAEMPDIVEVTDKYTLSMMGIMIRANKFKQIGRPMLVHFSCERMDDNIGSFLSEGKFGKWFARRVIGNYTMPSFDYHIANSTYTAEEFVNSVSIEKNPRRSKWFFNKCWRWLKAPRVPVSERVFVCPRGVDASQFSPDRKSEEFRREMRVRAGIPQDSTVLLYAGRISPEKNIPLLVEMMAELSRENDRDYRLLVAGAGPLSDWLQTEGDKLGERRIVQFGHLDKETLSNYYSNADVFVHPNPREPFGIAPLEAMASGVATVAPNAGGILSYANGDNAWLVEPNGKEFANAVREIVSNATERKRRIANAVDTALANTREASTDRLIDTYQKMYADFRERNDLFTNREATKNVNYLEFIDV